MKLTPKQRKTLSILERFIPSALQKDILPYYVPEVATLKEAVDGVSAEQAFFDKSERGIQRTQIHNVKRFLQLLYAQRRMALHVTMWKDDIASGLLRKEELDETEQQLI